MPDKKCKSQSIKIGDLVSFNNNVDFIFNKTGSNKKIGLVVKVIDSSAAGVLMEIYIDGGRHIFPQHILRKII
jgi:hypothetical protein